MDGLTDLKSIDSSCFVVSEKHLQKKMKDYDGVILASAYPSAESLPGDLDNCGKDIIGLIYVIQKVSPGNEDEKEELATYEKLQQALLDVEKKFKEDCAAGDKVMSFLEPDSIQIDPSYQDFGGYNGWSMTFKLAWYE